MYIFPCSVSGKLLIAQKLFSYQLPSISSKKQRKNIDTVLNSVVVSGLALAGT